MKTDRYVLDAPPYRFNTDARDVAKKIALTYFWKDYVGKNYKRLNNQNKILILGLLSGILCYLIQNEFSFGNTPIVALF